MVFKPLPKQINAERVDRVINPKKDADALSPNNLGLLVIGDENGLIPATPEGIIKLLDYYHIEVKGKSITIINNSTTIGKPLSILLTNRFATVTICNIFTENLENFTQNCEILITAAGVPNLIKPSMISDKVIIIDAGIAFTIIDGQRVHVGDVSETCKDKARMITSATPGLGGGVGPLTTAVLAENVIKCAKNF